MSTRTTDLIAHYPMSMESVMLIVQTNGGSLDTQIKKSDGTFVTSDTITEEGAYEIFVRDSTIKFVPTGGAEFDVHEGV